MAESEVHLLIGKLIAAPTPLNYSFI